MSLDLVAIRRDIHRHPETAFNEHRTASVIESILRSLGLHPHRVASTGVVCDIEGSTSAPLLALRADIDALPINEQSGVEFASEQSGTMHACGHDTHATILLGVAERLLATKAQLPRGVRLLFQPAEETTEGAQEMIAANVLDNVAVIYGLHNYPALPVGAAAFRSGALMASSDRFLITVTGKGGHAASPHLAADPLVAGAAVLSGIQTIVSRAVNPLEPAVVTVGRFQGGTTFNVIPDHAVLEGTVRCFSAKLRESMPVLLGGAASSIAAGHRCEANLRYQQMVPAVHNNEYLTALAREVAASMLGTAAVTEAQLTMGAEDFALYQEKIPGCLFWLGSGGAYNWHHPCFTVDEGMLDVGVNLLTAIAQQPVQVP